ncbi:MAG: nicotinamide riboside transporter PnuC [Marinifilaceae bacterium]|jgi:nicotinamide mononucleotide transporter|nr:nicotinamide riboside transporter PnuC [Marinifilaceae bacterium]
MLNFILQNIELIGTILGIIYVILEIKQLWVLWPVGILTALAYIIVFYNSKLYADMSLQFYYVFVSVYGWYLWISKNTQDEELKVTKISKKTTIKLAISFIPLYTAMSFVLVKYTDASLPYWDALTTSLSIIGTWMLAKKIIEQWYIWIFVNIISIIMYIYKGLNYTVILFLVYAIMSIIGYFEWKKSFIKSDKRI